MRRGDEHAPIPYPLPGNRRTAVARIAITGGTGFVGIHTSRALAAAGHDLRLLARGTRQGPLQRRQRRQPRASAAGAGCMNGACGESQAPLGVA